MAVKAPADKRFKRGRVKTPRKAARRWTALVRPLVKWTLVLRLVGYATGRALALVTESPALRISHVAVQGHRHLTPADVLSRVRMLDGQNIVRADLEAARRRLLGSPWIAEATLRRQLPATIEIAIEERRAGGAGAAGARRPAAGRRATAWCSARSARRRPASTCRSPTA